MGDFVGKCATFTGTWRNGHIYISMIE